MLFYTHWYCFGSRFIITMARFYSKSMYNQHLHMKRAKNSDAVFDRFASRISKLTGSSKAFISAIVMVILWGITGPIFHFSDTWQLVINTGTTIITFLMVFVIQEAQNKDTLAIQLKLNELIAATKGASNRVLNLEDMTEEELKVLKKFYSKLSGSNEHEDRTGTTQSIDDMKNGIEESIQILTDVVANANEVKPG